MRCWQCCASVNEVAVAPASVDDVRAIARRRGFDEAGFRLAVELADRGSVWVARDQGEVVGIAIAHASERERYVGDLFVEPSYRGQGIGGRLLDAAFADAEDVVRAMLVDPAEPAGYALSLRHGLSPGGSIARLAGAIPREEDLARMAAGDYRFQVEALDLATHESGVNALDCEVRGTARTADHAYFERFATGQAFFLNGEFVAYAYVWPDGRIGPLAAVSPAYLVQIFAYSLVTVERRYLASWCTMLVPGSNTRIARAAFRVGLRIHDIFLLASDTSIADISSYAGYHQLLV
jgi:GNAT superfamily N-acetyltransferase